MTLIRKVISIFLKKKLEQSQRVIISYIEGALEIYFYKVFNQRFDKIVPDKSKWIKFEVFPYNSRYCNIKSENKIVISGGVDHEKMCCVYDYDINSINELPNMPTARQMHSMINIDDRVFFVGGNHCKKVECLSLHFEDWTQYPDLNYDRREAGLGIIKGIENSYLYAFMGYSNTLGENCRHLERLDLNLDHDESKWQLLPIQNPQIFDYPYVTHLGIVNYKNGFLLIGGIANTTCTRDVHYYDIENYSLERSIFKLPFEGAFAEKSMFTYDDKDYYLFSFGTYRLIKFDTKQNCLVELIQ